MATPGWLLRAFWRNGSHLASGFGCVLVCLVCAITTWTWRCVVFLGETGGRGAALALFHAALVPFVVSYFRCVRTNMRAFGRQHLAPFAFSAAAFAEQRAAGRVGEAGQAAQGAAEGRERGGGDRESRQGPTRGGVRWGEEELEALAEELMRRARKLGMWDLDGDGVPRYCWDCELVKPDRSHHCSVCRACVLRFDHHCPWINNCVGLGNHKYFVCFLFWSVCCASLVAWYQHDRAHCNREVAFNYIFLVSFGFAEGLLLVFHLAIAWKDMTTLEVLEAICLRSVGVRRVGGALEAAGGGCWRGWLCGGGLLSGSLRNVKVVMGEDVWLWALPTTPRGAPSGASWPRPADGAAPWDEARDTLLTEVSVETPLEGGGGAEAGAGSPGA